MKRSDRPRSRALCAALLVLSGAQAEAFAQATNITPSGLNTATPALNSTTTAITGGTRSGANLFHSFGEFSIGTNHTALFQNSDGGATSNIFGRVTGGNESRIFGTIDSATNFPTANLWLLNPAGFFFGPTATLNVGGSVNISTADYLKMTDGKQFFADASKNSVLSMEPVAAFGFMGTNPLGTITVQGGTVNNASTLTLVGRDLVDGSGKTTASGILVTGGTLANAGGGIHMVSVKQPVNAVIGGEVGVSGTGRSLSLTPQNFTNLGEIKLTGGATIDTSGNAAGPIVLRGSNVVMVGENRQVITGPPSSSLLRSQTGDVAGGDITISADTVDIQKGWAINSSTAGAGAASAISLNAGTLRVNVNPDGTPLKGAEQVNIGSDSFIIDSIVGGAGSVSISGPGLESTDAAKLVALHNVLITTIGAGGTATTPPGNITITADTVALNFMSIQAGTAGSAPAGNIAFHVKELRANVNPNGTPIINGEFNQVRITTEVGGDGELGEPAGPAGSITISWPGAEGTDAAKLVALHDTVIGAVLNGGLATNSPGSITITADTVTLGSSPDGRSGRTFIGVQTLAPAPAGNITFNVKTLRANVDKTGQTIAGGPGVIITADAALDTATIDTDGDGFPDTLDGIPDTLAAGNAGSIRIQGQSGSATSEVRLANTQISTLGGNGTQPGNITIAANVLDLRSGTNVLTNTIGTAPAGTISLKAGNLTAASTLVSSSSGLDTNRDGVLDIRAAGRGGDVTIQAGDVILNPGSTFSAQSIGAGNAGNIFLGSLNNILMRNSTIASSADQASGGNIKLTAPNAILIADSTITSSVQGQAGSNGGNISIDPIAVAIQNSQILANANAGAGGNIDVVASGAVLVDPNTTFSASAGPAGVSGTVNINAPIQVLGGTLVPLKVSYSQPALSGDRCAADPQGRFSSFVQTGRDGVPQIPGGYAPSPLLPLHRLISNVLGVSGPKLAAARLGLASLGLGASTQYQFQSGCRS